MIRWLLVLALTSCTFTHAALSPHAQAPQVRLSPAMSKLDHAQHQSPWWTAATDIAIVLTGFMAGPIACPRVSVDACQPLNLLGLSVSGLTLVSLGVTIGVWGRL